DLNVRYLKPVPLAQTTYCVCRNTGIDSRFFTGTGEIVDSKGTVLATCSAKYYIIDIKRLAEKDGLNIDDINVNVKDDIPVTQFIIGE
ncbi:MAG: hypothetical protein FWD32_02160, partial [Firmicutes bacterium]|nr:hypothetical protein [Bacillota bacterium]